MIRNPQKNDNLIIEIIIDIHSFICKFDRQKLIIIYLETYACNH